ncbi:MAG: hypothetical protein WBA31_03780 [Candidatus Dormiibacterota bacterium]
MAAGSFGVVVALGLAAVGTAFSAFVFTEALLLGAVLADAARADGALAEPAFGATALVDGWASLDTAAAVDAVGRRVGAVFFTEPALASALPADGLVVVAAASVTAAFAACAEVRFLLATTGAGLSS